MGVVARPFTGFFRTEFFFVSQRVFAPSAHHRIRFLLARVSSVFPFRRRRRRRRRHPLPHLFRPFLRLLFPPPFAGGASVPRFVAVVGRLFIEPVGRLLLLLLLLLCVFFSPLLLRWLSLVKVKAKTGHAPILAAGQRHAPVGAESRRIGPLGFAIATVRHYRLLPGLLLLVVVVVVASILHPCRMSVAVQGRAGWARVAT